jgi:hypothetical protein
MQNVYLMEKVAAQRRNERQGEAGQQRLILAGRPATRQPFTWRGLAPTGPAPVVAAPAPPAPSVPPATVPAHQAAAAPAQPSPAAAGPAPSSQIPARMPSTGGGGTAPAQGAASVSLLARLAGLTAIRRRRHSL